VLNSVRNARKGCCDIARVHQVRARIRSDRSQQRALVAAELQKCDLGREAVARETLTWVMVQARNTFAVPA
jgi:hypothetical protein